MTHKHSVHDSDAHFIIDAKTRTIKDSNAIRTKLAQGDHKSERLTFEMSRYIDGHDMSLCNVEIHYNNISEDGSNESKDIYLVNDIEVNTDNPSVITFSWLVSGNATKYNGVLGFTIVFKCMDGINVTYKWSTFIYSKITIGAIYDNGENIVELYSDILEQWKTELYNSVLSEVNENVVSKISKTVDDKLVNVNKSVDDKIEAVNKSVDDKLEGFSKNLDHTKDYDINDKNNPAYIKNRPIYKGDFLAEFDFVVENVECNWSCELSDNTFMPYPIDVGKHAYGFPIWSSSYVDWNTVKYKGTYELLRANGIMLVEIDAGIRLQLYMKKYRHPLSGYTHHIFALIDEVDANEIPSIYLDEGDADGINIYIPAELAHQFTTTPTITIKHTMSEEPPHRSVFVSPEYVPLFQPDCNETDKTKPGFIKNMPVKVTGGINPIFTDMIVFFDLMYSYNETTVYDITPNCIHNGKRYSVTFTQDGNSITYNGTGIDGVIQFDNNCGTLGYNSYRYAGQITNETDFNNFDMNYKVYLSVAEHVKEIICTKDGTPLNKSYAVDSEKYRYGDELLKAIAGNRIPLIKIPNEDDADLYDNFVLPWQIQVPKNGNDYINVFYTKDKFAQKLVALLIEILSKQDFTNLEEKFGTLFGEMDLQLHTPCEEASIECEKPLD